MEVTVSKKSWLAWLVVLCMTLPMLMPAIVTAQTPNGVISVDGTDYVLSAAPEVNETGLMVCAEDAAKAFGLEYAYDSANKAFELYDELHGKIVLMHNATVFYSGENIYECAPYFYVNNGVPMVEIGFFCNMFSASYTYDASENRIVIDKEKLSDEIAKMSYNGNVLPMYIEPMEMEYGLIARVADLASILNLSFAYDAETKTGLLTDKLGNFVELTDGAESFKCGEGEIPCGPLFRVEQDIPMMEIGFFCDLYNISYTYDASTKTLVFSNEKTMEELANEEALELMAGTTTLVSGNVYCPDGAPVGGLNVKLILQQTNSRYSVYGGYIYSTGNNYIVGTVELDEGETEAEYTFDVARYYSSSYPHFALYYEETDAELYGYYDESGKAVAMAYSPLEYHSYNYSAYEFDYGYAYSNVNLILGRSYLSGTVSLKNKKLAPTGGLDVDLILQTRSTTYTDKYGSGSYYYIGNNYRIGTVTIPAGNNGADYKFDISNYYTDTGSYKYYSLYYDASAYADYVKPYGYYNNSSSITSATSIPSYSSSVTTIKRFDFNNSRTVNFVLPTQTGYDAGDIAAATPEANVFSGSVAKGTCITLSSGTEGTTIYYTTDGTTPTKSSTKYTESILLEQDTVIKAIAVKSGLDDSEVAIFEYYVNDDVLTEFVSGSSIAIANGQYVELEPAPFVENGKLFAPVRTVAEAIDASVTWSSANKQAKFEKGSKSVTYTEGDGNLLIKGGRVYVSVSAVYKTLLDDRYSVEILSDTVTVNYVGKKTTVQVSSATKCIGDEIVVDVTIKNNVGIAGFKFNLEFDNTKLTPVSIAKGSVFEGSLYSNISAPNVDLASLSEVTATWSGDGDVTADGVLYSVTFKIRDDAQIGIAPLNLVYDEDNVSNQDYQNVEIRVVNGQVNIVNVIMGDIYNDGKVDIKDAIKLAQYLAEWDVVVTDNELAAANVFRNDDVGGRAVINVKDAIKLAQYLAEWDVTLD